jgi:hypothetical protein
MLSLLFILVLIAALVLFYRRVKRKRTFWITTAVALTGYLAWFIPELEKYRAFVAWRHAHTVPIIHVPLDRDKVRSVYLRYLSCLGACERLLYSNRVDYVETPASFDPSNNQYHRWRLETRADICWKPEIARDALTSAPRSGYRDIRGYLAQGVCILRENSDQITADVAIQREQREMSSGAPFESRIFKAYAKREGARELSIESHGRSVPIKIPFLVWLHHYYGSGSIRAAQAFMTHGAMRDEEFIDLVLGTEIADAPPRSLFSEDRLPIIPRAARHGVAAVRWSAALAICELYSDYPLVFDAYLEPLLSDENWWVRGAAELTEMRISNGWHCTGSVNSSRGFNLLGQFFNDETAKGPDRSPLKGASRNLEHAAEQNDAQAQYQLAKLYEHGSGRTFTGTVPKDPEKAAYWHGRAAENGLADAQYALALMYQYGLGVRRDKDKVKTLMRLAADGGNKAASTYWEQVSKK